MILIFIMCSIFFARLVYVLCYVLDVNIIQTKMGDLSEAVIAGRKPVWEFNSFYLVFYVIFEIVPSVLLLMIYFMLSVHTTSAKKEKKQMSGQTHPIEKGKGNVSYAERDRTGREKNGSRAKSKDKKRSAGKKKTAYLKDDDEGFYSEPWRMSGGGKGKAREEGMFGAVHNVGGERGSEGEPEMSKPLLYERAVNQTGGGGMGWSEGGRESGVAVRPDTSKASGTIKRIPSVNLGTQPELFDGEPSYYYTPKSSKPTSYIISL
ncbi:uncharacterized protein MONOS_314 [Monocercomonoides exilis]|uniref:uncharacterized protein n=1 Tax=Monocercomonoides exilis TaxID=2049356 RepID=UPI00355A1E6A|nr:hypothetical protein MONOS_314 [Monocercomonoides exilis]|eukprot:MONOS_314.1-p1 / transcript=MONOS_314.1 / gene=MONOS_314 / organism=Monocercomonoides_exilis_PA203 / gene_product=unspecified product / transcript_product=unspecified product / location=Mono_scaffold00005:123539-124498(+) / protein_length=263 / sequence_SO=supercontig / SO=protein_coding / is_pseudo=false